MRPLALAFLFLVVCNDPKDAPHECYPAFGTCLIACASVTEVWYEAPNGEIYVCEGYGCSTEDAENALELCK